MSCVSCDKFRGHEIQTLLLLIPSREKNYFPNVSHFHLHRRFPFFDLIRLTITPQKPKGKVVQWYTWLMLFDKNQNWIFVHLIFHTLYKRQRLRFGIFNAAFNVNASCKSMKKKNHVIITCHAPSTEHCLKEKKITTNSAFDTFRCLTLFSFTVNIWTDWLKRKTQYYTRLMWFRRDKTEYL